MGRSSKEVKRREYLKHRDRYLAHGRRYYLANRKAKLEYAKTQRRDPIYRRRCTLKKYGLTIPQYERLLQAQGGVCAICHRPETNSRLSCLSVDHNHTTNKVRGLLCSRCNIAVGMLQDNASLARNLAQYLDATREPK